MSSIKKGFGKRSLKSSFYLFCLSKYTISSIFQLDKSVSYIIKFQGHENIQCFSFILNSTRLRKITI